MTVLKKKINGKDKMIGNIDAGIFRKVVNKKEHLFRSNPSWAVDLDIWDAIKAEAEYLEFHEITERKVYRCPKARFEAHGFNKEFAGFDMQRFLPVKFWDVFDAYTGERLYKYEPPAPPKEQQQSLF